MKVASRIVDHQKDFLEHGEEAMKPLVLHNIAEAVSMHESTISRVTTQKYMHTPRGIFELKYFFSSHVSTQDGGEFSSTAIRAIIKRIVAEEMEIRSKLLEHVGQRIINKVLLKAPLVNYVKVTVSKVNPPIGGDVAEVSVTLSAKR